jgi:hypothetical protein
MDELKEKLLALGVNEDQIDGVIEAFVDFIKGKLPDGMEGMVQGLMDGDSSDANDLLDKAKGLFGG